MKPAASNGSQNMHLIRSTNLASVEELEQLIDDFPLKNDLGLHIEGSQI